MRTSCYKFHRKYKLPLFILGGIISTIPLYYYFLVIKFYNFTYTTIQLYGFALYIPCIFILSAILYKFKAYIEITPTHIRINNSDKLLWEDIICLRTINIEKSVFWVLEIEDLSKYHLTYSQKNMLKSGLSPFMIAPSYLSQKNCEQLKNILKLHITQNDLD